MIELLSPVGDFECLKAAVQNGANAVYFGANQFNARQNATNFDDDGLKEAIQYAKLRNVKINFTLNTLIKDSEFEDAVNLVKKVYALGADAIIVQDLGLAQYIIKKFPEMDVHASTQMTIHNLDGVLMLQNMGFKRVVLSRELSLHEIEHICNNSNVEIECFVHGALCICYSGQCLLSSSIGGRSGNRGKCAQPCRLPYKLFEEDSNNKITKLNEGYLLSTRDFCSLKYLDKLINAGVTSFKIEGRMKTPEYVATCTKIYRKYIDLALSDKPYIVDENDIKLLMQVFNRGAFSSSNLLDEPNRDYVFKEKPNNMGLYIGNVSNINPKKGLITFKTNEKVEIGDKISFQKEEHKYTISELMKKNENIKVSEVDDYITIGRMKGNINLGDRVYKLSNSDYSKSLKDAYNSENIKIPLMAYVRVKKDKPLSLEVVSKDSTDGAYFSISTKQVSDIVPIEAISNPITKERISSQLNKTTDTQFQFENIVFDMDEDAYIPKISAINELRRRALEDIENQAISRFSRDPGKCAFDLTNNKNKLPADADNAPSVALLLRQINLEFDYSKINNVDSIYVPFLYFKGKQYYEILRFLSSKAKLYVYLPHIIKDNFKNIFFNEFDKLIEDFNVYGLVISNPSCIHYFDDYKDKLDIVANYTFNIFNNYTIDSLKSLGIKRVVISPELDEASIKELNNQSSVDTELMVYGNLRLMTTGYCLLGESNLCYPDCATKCRKNGAKFYLNDRLNMNFRIILDSIQTITAIYNSRTTSISYKNINPSFVRISVLDESIDEINKIIDNVQHDIVFEGENFTKGNFNKTV